MLVGSVTSTRCKGESTGYQELCAAKNTEVPWTGRNHTGNGKRAKALFPIASFFILHILLRLVVQNIEQQNDF